ncbi:MAG: Mth938-like domain-containing protein [Pseudomonadota bacterium]
MTPDPERSPKLVQGYGDGGFRISGQRYEGSLIVLPSIVHAWPIGSISEVTAESLIQVSEADDPIDILLIGSGHGVPRIDEAVRNVLRPRGIVTDVMDTGAACRTFNLLVADARRVAAAMIAV